VTRLPIRRSTAALCGFFLLTLAVYLLVRPPGPAAPLARHVGEPAS
jgi:hypothetical protein